MSEKLEKFRKTYSGKKLLEQHSLNEVGVWEIRGEDQNCDWGGSHHEPYLATVEGKLSDVIENAVDLPGFWTWGGGGSIKQVRIMNMDELSSRATLAPEKIRLENRIKELNKLL